jgi:hypothetical protein
VDPQRRLSHVSPPPGDRAPFAANRIERRTA